MSKTVFSPSARDPLDGNADRGEILRQAQIVHLWDLRNSRSHVGESFHRLAIAPSFFQTISAFFTAMGMNEFHSLTKKLRANPSAGKDGKRSLSIRLLISQPSIRKCVSL